MKGVFYSAASWMLTLPAILVHGQSYSCYTTTTVVYGDPYSILSSLSMVSNTTLPTTPPPSVVSSTTTSSSPAATGLFRIEVNAPNAGKLRTRGPPDYIALESNGGAIIVPDPSQATLFQFINGFLETSTGLYVGASMNDGTTQLEASSVQPAVAQGWTASSDGSVSLGGSAEFCSTSTDAIYIVFNGQPAAGCNVVTFTALTVASSSSITSSQSVISTENTSSTPAPPLTTNVLSSLSMFEGSSQLVSLASLHSEIPVTTNDPPTTNIFGSISTFEANSQLASLASIHSEIPPQPATTSGGSIPGSSIILPASSTSSSVYSTSISSTVSSSSALPSISSYSSSVLHSTSNDTSILSTSTIFSVVSSSTSSRTSTPSSSPGSSPSSAGTSSTSFASSSISSSSSSPSSSPALRTTTSSIILSTSLTPSSASSSSSLPPVPSPYQRNSGKRGLVYTNITLTKLYALQGQNSLVSWAYDYAQAPNASNNAGTTNPALTFIPLLFNDSPGATSGWAANVNYSITHYGTDAIFSFNEPDACYSGDSACMTVNQSVAGYQAFMQPFAGTVKLGAPAVTNGASPSSLTYLSWFLGNCTGCTVDFINLHWYSSPYSFSYLQSYVAQAYVVGGGRPIYISEFGMDSVYYLEADVATFLKNATTWLDGVSYVSRYSWFGDFAQSGPATQQGLGYLVNSSGNALSTEGVVWNNYTGGYLPCPGTAC